MTSSDPETDFEPNYIIIIIIKVIFIKITKKKTNLGENYVTNESTAK